MKRVGAVGMPSTAQRISAGCFSVVRLSGRCSSVRPLLLLCLSTLCLSLLCLTAPSLTARALAQSESHSIGHSAAGRLLNGVELPDSQAIQTYARGARYGTAELVAMLGGAAEAVRAAHPRSAPLTVGDLSRRRGGGFPPHRSHRNGRDVDVGFYYVDGEGAPMVAPRFLGIRRDGQCTTPGGAPCRLDLARTWTLLTAMLPPDTPVQYMLIAPHIRTLLLEEAERRHSDAALVRRFRAVSLPTAQSRSHVNHVHVRVYCAEDDRPRCIDPPPHLPWYRFPEGTDPGHVTAAAGRVERRLGEDAALEARARAQRAQFVERAARLRAMEQEQRAARAARRARGQARAAAAAAVEAAARSARRERARLRAQRGQAAADEAAGVRAARRERARLRAQRAQAAAAEAAGVRAARRERARLRVQAREAEQAQQRAQRRARARARAERAAADAAAERAVRRARAQARADAMAEAEAERLQRRTERRGRRPNGVR